MAHRSARRRAAVSKGFRSGFEADVAAQLDREGVEYEYETLRLKWTPESKTYTPDFILPGGVIVEVKGRLTSADRVKHLAIKKAHPDLDIRFLFAVDNKLSPKSPTRYSAWCEKHGFLYAFRKIPEEWYS